MLRSPARFAIILVFPAVASLCVVAFGEKELAQLTAADLRKVVSRYLNDQSDEKPALARLGVTLDLNQIAYRPAGMEFGTLRWEVSAQRRLDEAEQQEVVTLVLHLIANAIGQAEPQLLNTADYNSIFDERQNPKKPGSIDVEIAQPLEPPIPGTQQRRPGPPREPKRDRSGRAAQTPDTTVGAAVPTVAAGSCWPDCADVCCAGACCGTHCRRFGCHRCRHAHSCTIACGSCCAGAGIAATASTVFFNMTASPASLARAPVAIAPWKPSDDEEASASTSARLSTIAFRSADDALPIDPRMASLRFGAAYHAYWRGEYSAAIRFAEEGLNANDTDPRLWYYKGLAELALGLETGYSESFSKATYYRAVATPGMQSATTQALCRVQGLLRLKFESAAEKASSMDRDEAGVSARRRG